MSAGFIALGRRNTLASTFSTIKHAEDSVITALHAGRARIAQWLSSNAKGDHPISLTMQKAVGWGVDGAKKVNGLKNVTVILRKDGHGSFNVLTAYPGR